MRLRKKLKSLRAKLAFRKLLTGGLTLAALIIITIVVMPPAIYGYSLMESSSWVGLLVSILLLAVPISLAGTYYVSSRFRQAVFRSMMVATGSVNFSTDCS